MGRKTKNNLVQQIVPMIPIIGSFLIFLGVLRLIVFYRKFGVEIVSYLEFTEILTSFLDIIVLTIFTILYAIIQNRFAISDEFNKELDKSKNAIYKTKSFFKRLPKYFKLLSTFLLAWVVFVTILSIGYYYWDKNFYELIIGSIAMVVMIVLIILLYEFEIKIIDKKKELKKNYRLIFYVIIISFATISQALYQEYRVKKDKITRGYTITLNNGEILKSNSENYYIGKTTNYLFYYHSKLKMTDAIPMERVQLIEVPNKTDD